MADVDGDGEGPQWAPRWKNGVPQPRSRRDEVVRRYVQLHALGTARIDYDPYRVREVEADEEAVQGVLCGGAMSHMERDACWRTDGDVEVAGHPASVGALDDRRRVKVCYYAGCGRPLYCVWYNYDELMRHAWGWRHFPYTHAPIDGTALRALDVRNMGMSHLDEQAAVHEQCAGDADDPDDALSVEVDGYLAAKAARMRTAARSYRRRDYASEAEAARGYLEGVQNRLVRDYLEAVLAGDPAAAKAAHARFMREARARGWSPDSVELAAEAPWELGRDDDLPEEAEEPQRRAARWDVERFRRSYMSRDALGRGLGSVRRAAGRARSRVYTYLYGDGDDGDDSDYSDDSDDDYPDDT